MASCFFVASWAGQYRALQILCASCRSKAKPRAPGKTWRVACGRPWQRIRNTGDAPKKCHTLALEKGRPLATNGHMWMHISVFSKGPSLEIAGALWDMVTSPRAQRQPWAPPHWAGPWLPTRPGKQPHLQQAATRRPPGFQPQTLLVMPIHAACWLCGGISWDILEREKMG